MSRAVLLPTPGDPFLLEYWLKCYKHIWGGEVDSLYVYVNSEIPDDVIVRDAELLDEAGAKVVMWAGEMIDHGFALEELLKRVDEDYVMLIEDDGFIFKAGQVDRCFKFIEEGGYEVVASKRGSCSPSIIEMAEQKWEHDYHSAEGDEGCNFWPNFFFCRTELLKSIGGHFGSSAWQPDEMIEGLEMRTPLFANGDTFVSASLRIRAALDKILPAEASERLNGDSLIHYEPQYHGANDDMLDYDKRTNIFDSKAAWTHAGSLSTGVTNLLNPEKPLPKNMANTQDEKKELERRVMYWMIFAENASPNKLVNFKKEYEESCRRLISHYDLSEGRILQRKSAYSEVLPKW